MKPHKGWMIVSIVIVTACATQMQSAGAGSGLRFSSDEAAIRAMFDTTVAGWNRGELPIYLSAYTDSATAMGGTGPVRGVNAIGDQMRAGYWKAGRPAQALHYEHLEIRPLGPDNSLVTGQYVLTGAGRPDRTGWFTTIWERVPRVNGRPGGWRMIHDHSS